MTDDDGERWLEHARTMPWHTTNPRPATDTELRLIRAARTAGSAVNDEPVCAVLARVRAEVAGIRADLDLLDRVFNAALTARLEPARRAFTPERLAELQQRWQTPNG